MARLLSSFTQKLVHPCSLTHTPSSTLPRLYFLRQIVRAASFFPERSFSAADAPARRQVVSPLPQSGEVDGRGFDAVGEPGFGAVWSEGGALRIGDDRRGAGREDWGREDVALALVRMPSSQPCDHRWHWLREEQQERAVQRVGGRLQEGGTASEPVRQGEGEPAVTVLSYCWDTRSGRHVSEPSTLSKYVRGNDGAGEQLRDEKHDETMKQGHMESPSQLS